MLPGNSRNSSQRRFARACDHCAHSGLQDVLPPSTRSTKPLFPRLRHECSRARWAVHRPVRSRSCCGELQSSSVDSDFRPRLRRGCSRVARGCPTIVWYTGAETYGRIGPGPSILPESTGGEAWGCRDSREGGFQLFVALASTVLVGNQKQWSARWGHLI